MQLYCNYTIMQLHKNVIECKLSNRRLFQVISADCLRRKYLSQSAVNKSNNVAKKFIYRPQVNEFLNHLIGRNTFFVLVEKDAIDFVFRYLQKEKENSMKVLVIPDVHLKPDMFEQAASLMRREIAERAVCLMDIPDDWGKEYEIELYTKTFDAAISFAKEYPDTYFCYGNHDLSYVWGMMESGYSSYAAGVVRQKLKELEDVLAKADNPPQYIQRIDNVIFCHGGLLDYFVRETVPARERNNLGEVINRINALNSDKMWNDASPIWFRPQYSKGKRYGEETILQVVGHTPVEKIERRGNVLSCDVFSTYRDGRPIGTREFLLLDTCTWEYTGIAG